MVAEASGHAYLRFKVRSGNFLVAIQGNQARSADGHGVGPQGQSLGGIGTMAYAAGSNEADLAVESQLTKRFPGHHDGRDGGNAAVLDQYLRRSAGARHHAVDDYGVGPCLGSQLNVVVDTARPQLDVDGDSPIRRLPQLLNFNGQVVRS